MNSVTTTTRLTAAPAGVKAWVDRTNYSMGLDDLDWVRGWVERAARDLERIQRMEDAR